MGSLDVLVDLPGRRLVAGDPLFSAAHLFITQPGLDHAPPRWSTRRWSSPKLEVWSAATLWVVPAPTSSPTATDDLSMSAGRPARSSGVAGHGFVQFAEGLLDAGVDLVSTVGAVLDCSRWLGRELGQPCPRLVGDRTRLVALGAVEATIRVWMRGVGHGDHPGSRSGWAARPAPGSEGTSMRRPEPLYPLPPAGSSQPCGCRNLAVDFAGNLR
jgi:hypothetical protein